MTGKTFVDTNVLIYACDVDAGRKHQIAKSVLEALWDSDSGALSTQVLQEFYVIVTRKLPRPLPKADARVIVNAYSEWSVSVSPADLLVAFRIEDEARIHFWDALIVATAIHSGASALVTEDLNPGQVIAGIHVENPFSMTN